MIAAYVILHLQDRFLKGNHVCSPYVRPIQIEEPFNVGIGAGVAPSHVFQDGILCGKQGHDGYLVLRVAEGAADAVPELVVGINALEYPDDLHLDRCLGRAADRQEHIHLVVLIGRAKLDQLTSCDIYGYLQGLIQGGEDATAGGVGPTPLHYVDTVWKEARHVADSAPGTDIVGQLQLRVARKEEGEGLEK